MRTKHLSFRSGNPALSSKTFENTSQRKKGALLRDDVMTIKGTVDKTAISLLLLLMAGYFSFSEEMFFLIPIGGIGGFIIALVTIFKKTWSPITVPLYAIFEGLLLGGISFMYSQLYEGIVFNAIMLTVSILLSLLFAYRSGVIKATENFKLGVFAATGGIFLVYIFSLIASFFGSGFSIMDPSNSSLMSIGFSLFVVVIASLNLVIDFDFIEEGAEKGAPKYMEWYGAFGLLVTLVWLYLEILRLLAKLNSRK
ncbi:MAG: Bax inhibitor-1/YccA family protein [Flavobacteriaceae bacterium]|jgi:uncharacterized YccA/Bax inhibitor family protein|nr:Bax inhibitor-1/YccA family protein [Flavobacteriaceae bacterium]MBT3753896.1 Bax inhibitor-1/YccA family protein [Flavobacteriaceae bacterium]MBT3794178.1 Bax inhibitor-1/YccA family protein [Flavobacteriaceae bacterium]MBT4063107.1 Bax inhibitor-1/YccA family protein [Flavobacteriaceae bacterium]MBT4245832.1 Bax inhibitor-1/YccA family protein [Flavobacteriaceae bacterium]|tara:strand:+ start:14478 stop:15239 length:762 start_codon:yes stop_codon:yes gene_type:complete